jgi:hypothetical protein
VDIFSDHFYPMDIDKLSAGVEMVASVDKVYLAAEYGWTPQTQTKTPMTEFFEWIERRQNSSKPVVVGGEYPVLSRPCKISRNQTGSIPIYSAGESGTQRNYCSVD